jgi:GGDEF domain-containing protein
VAEAARYVTASKAEALYVEVDVKNLGGLNAALGESEANQVFRRLAQRAEGALSGLEATVCAFRHGGDEISFVVAGPPGSTGIGLEEEVRRRLQSADEAARLELASLSGIRHPKHPERDDRAGTGLVFGTAPIGPGSDPEAVVSLADSEVERRKQPATTS